MIGYIPQRIEKKWHTIDIDFISQIYFNIFINISINLNIRSYAKELKLFSKKTDKFFIKKIAHNDLKSFFSEFFNKEIIIK
jgi:hypothetical protein